MRKKLIETLEVWQGRLQDSPEEEILKIFIKAMIDKINAQPKIPFPEQYEGDMDDDKK